MNDSYKIAAKHGRSFLSKDQSGRVVEVIFPDLCSELEASIESEKRAINNFTTQGSSESGEYAVLAINNLTRDVAAGTNRILNSIRQLERRLSILRAQYYDYAVKWQIELRFGNTSKKIFDEYREVIDRFFSRLPHSGIQKLKAIEDLMEDGNPEKYAQVVLSCRRLWYEAADWLFKEVLPNYNQDTFTTLSGKEIVVSGEHPNNKLSAVIETLQQKASRNTLVGSEVLYIVDWIKQISERQSGGVHDEISRSEAMKCIIHTYIALGDILRLREEMLGV